MNEPHAGEEVAILACDAENDAPGAITGLRFDDPYWDDAFCAWWDPALRICC